MPSTSRAGEAAADIEKMLGELRLVEKRSIETEGDLAVDRDDHFAKTTELRSALVRAQNDRLRKHGEGGSMLASAGVVARGERYVKDALRAVAAFDAFTPDDDPYGKHDFGSVVVDGRKVLWKVDYYDAKREFGSEDPADPEKTHRVLTICFAEEY